MANTKPTYISEYADNAAKPKIH